MKIKHYSEANVHTDEEVIEHVEVNVYSSWVELCDTGTMMSTAVVEQITPTENNNEPIK